MYKPRRAPDHRKKALSTTGVNHQYRCPRHALSHNIHHTHRPEGKLMSFCLKLILPRLCLGSHYSSLLLDSTCIFNPMLSLPAPHVFHVCMSFVVKFV